MKKVLKSILGVMLGLSVLVGCSSTSGEKKKVGIIQFVEHTSLNQIKDAFDKQMEALGYNDDNVEYVFANGNGDMNTCASIADQFEGENLDVVVAIATPAAMSVAKLSKKTPVVFSAVTDPIEAELTSSLENPDQNITGTCDQIQVDQMLETALKVQPDMKSIFGDVW